MQTRCQAAESRIVTAAHRVNAGRMPDLRPPQGNTDFYFVQAEEPDAIAERLVRVVTDRIPKRFGFDPICDVQVLTPMNRGTLGGRNLNQLLQATLNPPTPAKAEVERFGYTYRSGDKVLQTQNDYEKNVFNGDLGVITDVDLSESEVHVDYTGRVVKLRFLELAGAGRISERQSAFVFQG